LPAFVAKIRRLFAATEIHEYLDDLERTNYLAPPELDLETILTTKPKKNLGWKNPLLGAEELLRFSRLRQLLEQ
jgi:hypothetical protein